MITSVGLYVTKRGESKFNGGPASVFAPVKCGTELRSENGRLECHSTMCSRKSTCTDVTPRVTPYDFESVVLDRKDALQDRDRLKRQVQQATLEDSGKVTPWLQVRMR